MLINRPSGSGFVPPKGNSGNYTPAELQAARRRDEERRRVGRGATLPQRLGRPQSPGAAQPVQSPTQGTPYGSQPKPYPANRQQFIDRPETDMERKALDGFASVGDPNQRRQVDGGAYTLREYLKAFGGKNPAGFHQLARKWGHGQEYRPPSAPGTDPPSPPGGPPTTPPSGPPADSLPPDFEGPLPGPRDPAPGQFGAIPPSQPWWLGATGGANMGSPGYQQPNFRFDQDPVTQSLNNSMQMFGPRVSHQQTVTGPFGNNLTDMWNNMGGFVQAVNNQAGQKQVGTYLGPGAPPPGYGQMNYNIRDLINQGHQMVQGGWQNPFAFQQSPGLMS